MDDDTGEHIFGTPSDGLAAIYACPSDETVMIPSMSGLTEAERNANGGYAPQEVPVGGPAPRRRF